jgi:hypothetical protein
MTPDRRSFTDSLAGAAPPPGYPPLLRAVWHGLRGAWAEAHGIAQDIDTVDGAWVHAWLHRIEGDAPNAGYWYRRAGRSPFAGSTDEEGRQIADALIGPTGIGPTGIGPTGIGPTGIGQAGG